MTHPPYVDLPAITAAVSLPAAMDALEEALRAGWPGQDPLRTSVPTRSGEFLLMPSEGPRYVGIKVITVAPDNPTRRLPRIQGVYVLHDADSMTPLALFDAAALTMLRTPAVSAVATRHLARPDATELVVAGTGPQALGHVHAMRAVRPIERVGVVGRTPESTAAFAQKLGDLEIPAYAAGAEDVRKAHVLCLCTTARSPVVPDTWIGDQAHLNVVGSHEPTAREVETATVARSHVVVESREAALAEAGDLVMALADGVPPSVIIADLAELVRGATVDTAGITLFKSVGTGWEDLVVAALAYERLS
ncbi:ornithine cyclodeaminase [Planotetraspora silvatica]|uniref:Ornithine cyclodeaminase n=1 Tax=Planotetraspora silvatica TaxID=234614 RepID=A0A8J3XS34_9ACTN|nr:ornithine cyclodeaminase family protein [Planotetraspora silvatica]GII50780.1 ornithine cyclodeaminase [Planotetraspora silvatica]